MHDSKNNEEIFHQNIKVLPNIDQENKYRKVRFVKGISKIKEKV